jgi:hypothetical protein
MAGANVLHIVYINEIVCSYELYNSVRNKLATVLLHFA